MPHDRSTVRTVSVPLDPPQPLHPLAIAEPNAAVSKAASIIVIVMCRHVNVRKSEPFGGFVGERCSMNATTSHVVVMRAISSIAMSAWFMPIE
jgi:hypothetical protein